MTAAAMHREYWIVLKLLKAAFLCAVDESPPKRRGVDNAEV